MHASSSSSTTTGGAHQESKTAGCQAPSRAGGPPPESLRFPSPRGRDGLARGRGRKGRPRGRSRDRAAKPRRSSGAMWPSAEVPRAEPGPEARPHGGGSRHCSDACKLSALAPAVTRERPSVSHPGRSSAVIVPGWLNEVGGRLGTMARAGMERWRDRLALVTGASGGIGAAVARALVQQGLKVVGCARTVGNIEVRPR